MTVNHDNYDDYYILAINIGEIFEKLKQIAGQIKNGIDPHKFKEDTMMLAFVGRRTVLNRIEKHSYKLQDDILVPQIHPTEPMTLEIALLNSLEQVYDLAKLTDDSELVDNILGGGDAYLELEKVLPKEVLNKIR